jgi:hypothetical protein
MRSAKPLVITDFGQDGPPPRKPAGEAAPAGRASAKPAVARAANVRKGKSPAAHLPDQEPTQ